MEEAQGVKSGGVIKWHDYTLLHGAAVTYTGQRCHTSVEKHLLVSWKMLFLGTAWQVTGLKLIYTDNSEIRRWEE